MHLSRFIRSRIRSIIRAEIGKVLAARDPVSDDEIQKRIEAQVEAQLGIKDPEEVRTMVEAAITAYEQEVANHGTRLTQLERELGSILVPSRAPRKGLGISYAQRIEIVHTVSNQPEGGITVADTDKKVKRNYTHAEIIDWIPAESNIRRLEKACEKYRVTIERADTLTIIKRKLMAEAKKQKPLMAESPYHGPGPKGGTPQQPTTQPQKPHGMGAAIAKIIRDKMNEE